MKYLRIISGLLLFLAITGSCKYKKGSSYELKSGEDSIRYLLAAKGAGSKISSKAFKMKLDHELKGDSCDIRYLSDSIAIENKKSILLFSSVAPGINNDMLTKGFFGAFTSKQTVSYLIVSYEDIDKFIIKVD